MPTVVIGNNTGDDYSGVEDNQIDNNEPLTNHSASGDMAVGNQSGGLAWSFLLKFTGIPSVSGAVVSSASIYVYRFSGHWSSPTFDIIASRLLRNWDNSTSCWRRYSGTSEWSTYGALNTTDDISSTISASCSVSATNEYKEWVGSQLASDIQDIMTGVSNNYGWNFRRPDTGDYHIFRSSEDTDGQRPYLSVTYTESGGSSIVPIILAMNHFNGGM